MSAGKQIRPSCGARTRAGDPCRRKPVFGKDRCANRGGMSTGPRWRRAAAGSLMHSVADGRAGGTGPGLQHRGEFPHEVGMPPVEVGRTVQRALTEPTLAVSPPVRPHDALAGARAYVPAIGFAAAEALFKPGRRLRSSCASSSARRFQSSARLRIFSVPSAPASRAWTFRLRAWATPRRWRP